jgi:hypothetical protein
MKSRSQQVVIQAVGKILAEAGVCFEWKEGASDALGTGLEIYFPTTGECLLLDYRPGLAPFQLGSVLSHLSEDGVRGRSDGLCVRRMSWSLLDACKRANVALFDLEGNAYIKMPGVYIERIRPGRENVPVPAAGSVFTAKAARLVRAFLKRYPRDWAQVELVRETGLSAGYVSTLVKRLIGQQYVCNKYGLLYLEDPERLLTDWSAHYRIDRHRKLSYAISTGNYDEGLTKLGGQLEASGVRFAWTGWTGGYLRAPYSTPSVYVAYAAEAPQGMRGVFPVEKQGNVTLYLPHDEGVFQFTTPPKEGSIGSIVSDAQLYIDLCRMPGRAKEQADAVRHQWLDFSKRVV